MSRTKKGSKPPGFEYWSRRPLSGSTPGRKVKTLTNRIERRRARLKNEDFQGEGLA